MKNLSIKKKLVRSVAVIIGVTFFSIPSIVSAHGDHPTAVGSVVETENGTKYEFVAEGSYYTTRRYQDGDTIWDAKQLNDSTGGPIVLSTSLPNITTSSSYKREISTNISTNYAVDLKNEFSIGGAIDDWELKNVLTIEANYKYAKSRTEKYIESGEIKNTYIFSPERAKEGYNRCIWKTGVVYDKVKQKFRCYEVTDIEEREYYGPWGMFWRTHTHENVRVKNLGSKSTTAEVPYIISLPVYSGPGLESTLKSANGYIYNKEDIKNSIFK